MAIKFLYIAVHISTQFYNTPAVHPRTSCAFVQKQQLSGHVEPWTPRRKIEWCHSVTQVSRRVHGYKGRLPRFGAASCTYFSLGVLGGAVKASMVFRPGFASFKHAHNAGTHNTHNTHTHKQINTLNLMYTYLSTILQDSARFSTIHVKLLRHITTALSIKICSD